MKIPLFSKMTAKPRSRRVMRASARAMRGVEDDYYEPEPNMKLSHAFMVVLILHVVAVGGIYAFNHIKVNRKSDILANLSGKIAQAAGTTAPALAEQPVEPAPPQRQPGDADDPLPLVSSTSAVASSAPVAAAPAVAAPSAPVPARTVSATTTGTGSVPAARPETYTVEKGDNPYTIAKKFGVTYQDLLTLNGIEDPTKLQIGQVLKLPRKAN